MKKYVYKYLDTLFNRNSYQDLSAEYEEDEERVSKFDMAHQLLLPLLNNPNINRDDVIKKLEKQLQLKNSTAVKYYEQIVKEFNKNKNSSSKLNDEQKIQGDELTDTTFNQQTQQTNNLDNNYAQQNQQLDTATPQMQEFKHPNKQGVIRTVKNAHLVYKRQNEKGLFDELWVYKISNIKNEMKIKRNILSGTDIPPNRTSSEDNSQKASIYTIGNVQLVQITGLPN